MAPRPVQHRLLPALTQVLPGAIASCMEANEAELALGMEEGIPSTWSFSGF